MKLIRFATSNNKKAIKVGDKEVLNLRDRQQEDYPHSRVRPGLISGMEELASHYEISIVQRSTFNPDAGPDGSFIICLDKVSYRKSFLSQPLVQSELSSPGDREQVLITDGMVDVQCLKKQECWK